MIQAESVVCTQDEGWLGLAKKAKMGYAWIFLKYIPIATEHMLREILKRN